MAGLVFSRSLYNKRFQNPATGATLAFDVRAVVSCAFVSWTACALDRLARTAGSPSNPTPTTTTRLTLLRCSFGGANWTSFRASIIATKATCGTRFCQPSSSGSSSDPWLQLRSPRVGMGRSLSAGYEVLDALAYSEVPMSPHTNTKVLVTPLDESCQVKERVEHQFGLQMQGGVFRGYFH